MIFHATELQGAYLIEAQHHADERGFFARTFTPEEFEARGLDPRVAQVALAYNLRRGTLRGLHFQAAPHGQAKLVRCTRGAIWDVIVDLRPGSLTRGRHVACELNAENRLQLYVPESFAHGYLTLADESEVLYQLATPWQPAAESGVRWDDPTLAIPWPFPPVVVSARDAALPLLGDAGT